MSVDTVTRSLALRTICLANILLILTFASSDATGNSSLPWNDGNTTVSYGVTGPPINSSLNDVYSESCKVSTVDIYLYNQVKKLLTVEKVSLVEYRLRLVNYTDDPLLTNTTYAYRLNKWSRITTSHGQTLLGLAFNYGVLSIKTLTLGTDKPGRGTVRFSGRMLRDVERAGQDHQTLLVPLTRDFKTQERGDVGQRRAGLSPDRPSTKTGMAIFKDRCYTKNPNTGRDHPR